MEIKVPSLNLVVLGGRLTRDPELRYSPSGSAICNFSIASSRWRKKDEEWKEDTCFVDCVCFGALAERIGEKLKKGSPVTVEGRLETRQWEKDGKKFSKLGVQASRIQLLEREPREETKKEKEKDDEEDMELPF